MTLLHVAVQPRGRFTVLGLYGELDSSVVGDVEGRVRVAVGERGPHLVFDLSGLTFCDGMGLRLFLRVHMYTTRQGGSAALVGMQPQVRNLLAITGLHARLCVFESVAEALGERH